MQVDCLREIGGKSRFAPFRIGLLSGQKSTDRAKWLELGRMGCCFRLKEILACSERLERWAFGGCSAGGKTLGYWHRVAGLGECWAWEYLGDADLWFSGFPTGRISGNGDVWAWGEDGR